MPAKILIIEDDLDARQMLSVILEHAGFTIVCAPDGEMGFQAALAERPDLILTDLQMPRCDGVELIKRVREEPLLRDVPIMALTAGSDEMVAAAMQAGADRITHKPLHISPLILARS